MAQVVAHVDFNQHVEDLEEWNEEAGFVWGTPTVIHSNVVTVIHPHTYPSGPNGGGRTPSTVIAVYTLTGKRLSLLVIDGDGLKGIPHRDQHFDYWRIEDAT